MERRKVRRSEGMPMLYVLRYEMAPGVTRERLAELFPAHHDAWTKYRDDGTLVAIGPMENPDDGALSVFTNRVAAEEFARQDPFVVGGAVGTWQILAWREAIGILPATDSDA
jgi:uncharacterized protein